jgi:DNA polymerase-3 subunit delta
MKITSTNSATIIDKVKRGSVKSILLHGPNTGLSLAIINKIRNDSNFNVTKIKYKDLAVDDLKSILASRNFFSDKELVIIEDVTGAVKSGLKNYITETLNSNKPFDGLIIFYANESMPASGIRKIHEEGMHAISMGSYLEDEKLISKVISQASLKSGKEMTREAYHYLVTHLKGDHQTVKNELDKLYCFAHDEKIITDEIVSKILSPEAMANGDQMCIYFSSKQYDKFLQEVENLQAQNINEVLMIRALLRHYINLYIVTSSMEDGVSLSEAVKKLSPPVFFKYLPAFRKVAGSVVSADTLSMIGKLLEAEIEYKSNAKTFDFARLF